MTSEELLKKIREGIYKLEECGCTAGEVIINKKFETTFSPFVSVVYEPKTVFNVPFRFDALPDNINFIVESIFPAW